MFWEYGRFILLLLFNIMSSIIRRWKENEIVESSFTVNLFSFQRMLVFNSFWWNVELCSTKKGVPPTHTWANWVLGFKFKTDYHFDNRGFNPINSSLYQYTWQMFIDVIGDDGVKNFRNHPLYSNSTVITHGIPTITLENWSNIRRIRMV